MFLTSLHGKTRTDDKKKYFAIKNNQIQKFQEYENLDAIF